MTSDEGESDTKSGSRSYKIAALARLRRVKEKAPAKSANKKTKIRKQETVKVQGQLRGIATG